MKTKKKKKEKRWGPLIVCNVVSGVASMVQMVQLHRSSHFGQVTQIMQIRRFFLKGGGFFPMHFANHANCL